ncbi:MAG: type II toxin-antitoxin system death-on-curing family toxin [Syntrophobacterales bacterium]
MNPTFLSIGEVLEIHRDQIDRYGGDPGIRDLGLLQSALAMPAAGFGGRYLHGDLYEMAAAYLFHIIQNHPFVDGNKRTGVVGALVFLALNNVVIQADEDDVERLVRAVAEGEAGKATVSEFFRKHAQVGEGDVIS